MRPLNTEHRPQSERSVLCPLEAPQTPSVLPLSGEGRGDRPWRVRVGGSIGLFQKQFLRGRLKNDGLAQADGTQADEVGALAEAHVQAPRQAVLDPSRGLPGMEGAVTAGRQLPRNQRRSQAWRAHSSSIRMPMSPIVPTDEWFRFQAFVADRSGRTSWVRTPRKSRRPVRW